MLSQPCGRGGGCNSSLPSHHRPFIVIDSKQTDELSTYTNIQIIFLYVVIFGSVICSDDILYFMDIFRLSIYIGTNFEMNHKSKLYLSHMVQIWLIDPQNSVL